MKTMSTSLTDFHDSPKATPQMAPPSGGLAPAGPISEHMPGSSNPSSTSLPAAPSNQALLARYLEYVSTLRETSIYDTESELKKAALEMAREDEQREKDRTRAA